MKLVCSLIVVSLALTMTVPADTGPSMAERNREFFAALYQAHLDATDGPHIDWQQPEASRFLDLAAERAGALDLTALAALDGGGGGEQGFPVASDFVLMESHAEWTYVHQRPNRGTECSQQGIGQPGGHYDAAQATGSYVTHPDHQMWYTGVARSGWTTHGATGLAMVHEPGTFASAPDGTAPMATFGYEENVVYGGQSDFWCLNYRLVLFGICIYLDLNFPKVLGAGSVDPMVIEPMPQNPRPPCP